MESAEFEDSLSSAQYFLKRSTERQGSWMESQANTASRVRMICDYSEHHIDLDLVTE